tara:strand:- start:52 stop:756 length:705 start_codon:yes stop_codon:yes gene_type:complete
MQLKRVGQRVFFYAIVYEYITRRMIPDFKKNYNPDLFTWEELEYLINIRPLMSTDRVLMKDKRCEWVTAGWNLDSNCYPPTLLKNLLEKNICAMVDMSRCTKKINNFAKKIEDECKYQTDAHIYICRDINLEHPFGIHWDNNDNIIVQCEGRTHWKIWESTDETIEAKYGNWIESSSSPIVDVIMEPGDAIWVPLHYPHLATSLTPRLSVSFPISFRSQITKAREDRNWISFDR